MNAPDYRRVAVGAVHKAGEPAARLTREADGGITFCYEPGYRGPAVATSLPLGAEPVRTVGGALPPFFSGLLPEGRRLTAIRSAVKTSADDELSLLLAVGADVVGDVQVLPEGTSAPPDEQSQPDQQTQPNRQTPPHQQIQAVGSFADVSFREVFERAVGPEAEDRTALAGVQDKVSGRMISLPVEHRDAAWILKLDPPEFPHLVANEAFFLAAARESGLTVAEAHVVHDRDGAPGLLVRRFDRVPGDDGRTLEPRAQEDACQVLGRYPADKYRLTTEELIAGLAARTGAPIVAARTLLQQLAFAYLSCNGDAHGKNFSIVHTGTEWRVSPAYDLPSTHPYRDVTMALPIAGKDREDIGRADFVTAGEACGVPARATARMLDQLVSTAPRWLERLHELPFDGRAVHKLEKACRYRLERLR
jgi:serine/threonine-protein kinase HipA